MKNNTRNKAHPPAQMLSEKYYNHRMHFDKKMSLISSRFIETKNIDAAINCLLKDLGNLTGASRTYVFLIHDDNLHISNTHEWCAEGVKPLIKECQNIQISKYLFWGEKMVLKNEMINIGDISELPDTAKNEKKLLLDQKIKSLLIMPLYSGKRVSGLIGFDNVYMAGKSSDAEITILRIVSYLVSSKLKQAQVEAENENLEQRIKISEKMSTVGTFAGGIAHEFNNIIMTVAAEAEAALEYKNFEYSMVSLKYIMDAASSATEIIKTLLNFSKPTKPNFVKTSVNDIVNKSLRLVSQELKNYGIQVVKKIDPKLKLYADPQQMQQVFINLITNARDAMRKGGTLTITEERNTDYVIIKFADTGTGIKESDLSKIFDPFFSTKGTYGKTEVAGVGLGMSIVHKIISSHRGEISLTSKLNEGTVVSIKLFLKKKK